MKRFVNFTIGLMVICLFVWGSAALAFEVVSETADQRVIIGDDGRTYIGERYGGILANAPDYDWWYGCTPTSAGMMMGYYDINGYGGLGYDNLVPGGTAELSNYGNPAAIANDAIASAEHIADFWISYGSTGPDPCSNADPSTCHNFNCLADFMGTSQWAYNSTDGSTWLYYVHTTDNAPTTPADIIAGGITDESGMYGIGEYVWYSGYDYSVLYNQRPYGWNGILGGFTWNQYKAEIDAGRPVLIHITGHTMFGYGYSGTSTVYVHDTWTEGAHTMTWGGSYSGSVHRGVTPLTVTGGETPCDYCLTDTYGYDWCLNRVNTDGMAYYLMGTCDTGSLPLKDAQATYVYNGTRLAMTAYGGASGVIFTYNTKFVAPTRASGVWVTSAGATGHVNVDVVPCGAGEGMQAESPRPAPDDTR